MDPVFPFWRGALALLGGADADVRRRCFSVKMYVKMKELGPIGELKEGARPPWIRQTQMLILRKCKTL